MLYISRDAEYFRISGNLQPQRRYRAFAVTSEYLHNTYGVNRIDLASDGGRKWLREIVESSSLNWKGVLYRGYYDASRDQYILIYAHISYDRVPEAAEVPIEGAL